MSFYTLVISLTKIRKELLINAHYSTFMYIRFYNPIPYQEEREREIEVRAYLRREILKFKISSGS